MPDKKRNAIHVSVFAVLAVCVVAYLVAVIRGAIPKANRLGPAELAVVLLILTASVLFFRPDIVDRVSHFELSGLKIELQKTAKRQQEQAAAIDQLRILIPLLLPSNELQHLKNLASDQDFEYKANGTLRTELRRLSSVSLIHRRNGRTISELKDGLNFQLADYVRLTPLGRDWVKRIAELEKSESPST